LINGTIFYVVIKNPEEVE